MQAVWAAVGVVRLRPHARVRAPHPHARALPLHLPVPRRRRAAAAARFPASARRSTARGSGCGIGPLNFQPGEAAKVLLVVFFAAYLVDKRELLTHRDAPHRPPVAARSEVPRSAAARVGRVAADHGEPEGPRLVAAVLRGVRGDALHRHRARLVPRRRARCCSSAARRSRTRCSRTCRSACPRGGTRGRSRRTRASSSCSRCSRSAAAGSPGTGLGLGNPTTIPNVATDFVFSAIGEELGLIGGVGGHRRGTAAVRERLPHRGPGEPTVLEAVRGRAHHDHRRPDVRDHRWRHPVIPLTGVTLPFVSYGGSSLVANFVIVALLLRISADNASPDAERPDRSSPPAPRPTTSPVPERRR